MEKLSKSVSIKTKTVSWILNFTILITVIFHPKIQDPFNSPKFWVLLLSASWLLGTLIRGNSQFSLDDKKFYVKIIIVLSLYIVFLLISTVFSYNQNVSFFGESFRRNGSLTYIAFSVFFLSAAKFVRFENLKILFSKVMVVGIVTGTYALIQLSGQDFVEWSTPGSIITTLGNTNFAGASMAIFCLIIFGQIFIASYSFGFRILAFVVSSIMLLAILQTNARQALLILFVGIFSILLYKVFELNRKAFYTLGISGVATITVALLGLFQKGPLADLLYKQSVSVRGFYWRAGVEMFKDYPLLGVGVDNYGAFFKQYREAEYVLNHGFSITSSAAHNVFIQNFATGGVFVGISYLLLQILVFYRGLTLIKNFEGEKRLCSVILLVGWLSFQAQSFVSIDNIGISIWGWVIGGSIVGLSFNESQHQNSRNPTRKSIEVDPRKLLISVGSTALSLLLVLPLYSGEKNTWLARAHFNPSSTDPRLKELFEKYSNEGLKARFISTDYKNIILSNLYSLDPQKAMNELKQIVAHDYRNLDTLGLLAVAYEVSGNLVDSIYYRNKIAKYDPWNAPNYLELGLMYKRLGDEQNMKLMLSKILTFASSDPIAIEAKRQLILS
jgi:O-antigen ligase